MSKPTVELDNSGLPLFGAQPNEAPIPEPPAVGIPLKPDRGAIIQELETIAQFGLFERALWLADRETCCMLTQRVGRMGLTEPIPGELDTWRNTALGNELSVDLYGVFAGLFEPWDALGILENHQLIDAQMVDYLYACLEAGADPENLLRGHVQRAYFTFHRVGKYH